jgi:protein TonB
MERAAFPLRIDWPAVASLLVNGVIVLALLGLQIRREVPSAPTPAVTVVSLAVPKGSEHGAADAVTATAPEALPPTASALAAKAAPSPPPQPVAPAVTLPIAPAPSATAVPASAAPAAASATAQASPPARSAAPASAAPAVRKGVVDGLDAKAPAGTSRSYAARVRSWLYAHKTYPRRSRMRREEGLVQVRFVLDREGVLLEGAVTRKSGHEALDQEAEAMMQRSSPYPRAPTDLPGDRIEFTAPIEFALPL